MTTMHGVTLRARRQGSFRKASVAMASADLELPKTSGTRHHFVPRFLIARFSEPSGPLVHCLDIKSGRSRKTNPVNLAVINKLFTVDAQDGTADDSIEAFFAALESRAAPLLTKLEENPHALSREERAWAALFFASLQTRSPLVHGWAADAMEGAAADLLKEGVSRDEVARVMGDIAAAAAAAGSPPQSPQAERGGIADRAAGVVITAEWQGVLKSFLGWLPDLAEHIVSMSWRLVRIDEDLPGMVFVISDTPFVHVDPNPTVPYGAPALRSSIDARTYVPLSPRTCLEFASRGRPVETSWLAGARDVTELNRLWYGWAEDWIAGPSEAAVIRVRRDARHNKAAVPRAALPSLTILDEGGGVTPQGLPQDTVRVLHASGRRRKGRRKQR